MRKRTTNRRLTNMRKDVIQKLQSGAFGFKAKDIYKGSRVATQQGGAYKVIGDYCEEAYSHRPGQQTINDWKKEAVETQPTKVTRTSTCKPTGTTKVELEELRDLCRTVISRINKILD